MKTPITYYGGKQQLVKDILRMMPQHRIYCEPYFGGGAVFFAKGKSPVEVINDKDDRIITFYEVCQDRELFIQLQERIRHTLDSERLFMNAGEIWRHPHGYSKIEIAWSVWFRTNMGYGGTPDGGWKWDNGTSGTNAGIVMDGYRRKITEKIHERLKYVQISCREAQRVISERDTKETFFFLDPPYPGCVQGHYSGFTFEDLESLLVLLSSIKGKFMLCNFDSSLLQDFVKKNGWHYWIKDMPLRVANKTTKGTKRKQETIVMNYINEPTLF